MKFAASLILSCVTFIGSFSFANAAYKHENGMKFYIEGSEGTQQRTYQKNPRSQNRRYHKNDGQRSSENPLERLIKHTFVHLVPVWGGRKCGSRWTEVLVPDAFTSPMGSVNFARSCAIHDQCYTEQKGRKFCDRQIHKNLKAQCHQAFPQKDNHLKAECLNYSNIYFKTINQFGDVGYNAVRATKRQATRSYRSFERNSRSAAQWITGRKRLKLNR